MEHTYNLNIRWTGNLGNGTSGYRSYSRDHIIAAKGKPEILSSADPAFRGDKNAYNPEELLVASLSACHMLWFLHLCSDNGIIVTDYTDCPTGIMIETEDGAGHFKEVTLNPVVTVSNSQTREKLDEIHALANKKCFIANSVNFPVYHNTEILLKIQ